MTEKNNSDIKQKLIENVELKQIMLSYLELPAYYVLISAIIQSKANSITEIDAFSKKFFIVKNWKVTGFPVLFHENILNGEKESFVLMLPTLILLFLTVVKVGWLFLEKRLKPLSWLISQASKLSRTPRS